MSSPSSDNHSMATLDTNTSHTILLPTDNSNAHSHTVGSLPNHMQDVILEDGNKGRIDEKTDDWDVISLQDLPSSSDCQATFSRQFSHPSPGSMLSSNANSPAASSSANTGLSIPSAQNVLSQTYRYTMKGSEGTSQVVTLQEKQNGNFDVIVDDWSATTFVCREKYHVLVMRAKRSTNDDQSAFGRFGTIEYGWAGGDRQLNDLMDKKSTSLKCPIPRIARVDLFNQFCDPEESSHMDMLLADRLSSSLAVPKSVTINLCPAGKEPARFEPHEEPSKTDIFGIELSLHFDDDDENEENLAETTPLDFNINF
nr:uncharacterized protein CI109_003926 [Kwoniella shandongensis]KAA5527667.1 hypothetical protein CI109_003926 [Kwoniella shandongensis]